MLVLRPIRESDLEELVHLSLTATAGITSLPKSRPALEKKLEHAVASFRRQVEHPNDELYTFVLEAGSNRKPIGLSSIHVFDRPANAEFFYQVREEKCAAGPPFMDQTLLFPISEAVGSTELCSLFLLREWRKSGYGRLLSLGRFLFIASHQERILNPVWAILRGVIRKNETSPFWSGLGTHFMGVSFAETIPMLQKDRGFIANMVPKHPIYASLLPKSAQQAIGRPHPNTKGAQRLLESEGFHFGGEIDVFDGGPKLEANAAQIRSVKDSQIATVRQAVQHTRSNRVVIISNERCEDFRVCFGCVDLDDNGEAHIPNEAAEILEVHAGDPIRFVRAYPERTS